MELVGSPLQAVVEALSVLERKPGLNTSVWEAIVTYKAYVAGKKTEADVVLACERIGRPT